jgi:neutral ceramidase
VKVLAGAAVRDITPPAGLEMSGFAARSAPALGAHDPLTTRAIAIDTTVLVIADVIGIDAALSARICARAPGYDVIVAALHTHGGPVSMPGRLGHTHDRAYLDGLENGCVAAIHAAIGSRRPARLQFGWGTPPGIAVNRRSENSAVDDTLGVATIVGADDNVIAMLVSYACHPVVLDANNRHWTADYPHFVRAAIEAHQPGAVAIFAVGCAADLNTGHKAHASNSLAPNPNRTFATAQSIGDHIAHCALAAKMSSVAGTQCAFTRREVNLPFTPTTPADKAAMAEIWKRERQSAEPVRAALLDHWIAWASDGEAPSGQPYRVSVSAARWGELALLGLPGEIFADTGLSIRARHEHPIIMIGYAGDNLGYIPPRTAYPHGGYEVEEAHRFYRMPAAFAPGGAEAIADAALDCLGELWSA